MKNIKFFQNKLFEKCLFALFVGLNIYWLYYGITLFFIPQLDNGDEFYHYLIQNYSENFDFHVFTSTRAQPFMFLTFLVDQVVSNARLSARLVSLISGIILLYILLKGLEKKIRNKKYLVYGGLIFIFSVTTTNQFLIGTPDFFAACILIIAILKFVEFSNFFNRSIRFKEALLTGLLFAISIASRPTTIVIIFSLLVVIVATKSLRKISQLKIVSILIASIVTLSIFNTGPLLETHQFVFDVKKIPSSEGVTWFDRNYLMAKQWDEKIIPRKKWLSTNDVKVYRSNNPREVWPKNQLDMIVIAPVLYLKQMFRMTVMGIYSSIRYIYLILPMTYLFLWYNRNDRKYFITKIEDDKREGLKILFHTFLLSMLIFSFLAVKMLEFRWLIPIFTVLAFHSISFLNNLKEKYLSVIYQSCFLLSVLMFLIFFIRNSDKFFI